MSPQQVDREKQQSLLPKDYETEEIDPGKDSKLERLKKKFAQTFHPEVAGSGIHGFDDSDITLPPAYALEGSAEMLTYSQIIAVQQAQQQTKEHRQEVLDYCQSPEGIFPPPDQEAATKQLPLNKTDAQPTHPTLQQLQQIINVAGINASGQNGQSLEAIPDFLHPSWQNQYDQASLFCTTDPETNELIVVGLTVQPRPTQDNPDPAPQILENKAQANELEQILNTGNDDTNTISEPDEPDPKALQDKDLIILDLLQTDQSNWVRLPIASIQKHLTQITAAGLGLLAVYLITQGIRHDHVNQLNAQQLKTLLDHFNQNGHPTAPAPKHTPTSPPPTATADSKPVSTPNNFYPPGYDGPVSPPIKPEGTPQTPVPQPDEGAELVSDHPNVVPTASDPEPTVTTEPEEPLLLTSAPREPISQEQIDALGDELFQAGLSELFPQDSDKMKLIQVTKFFRTCLGLQYLTEIDLAEHVGYTIPAVPSFPKFKNDKNEPQTYLPSYDQVELTDIIKRRLEVVHRAGQIINSARTKTILSRQKQAGIDYADFPIIMSDIDLVSIYVEQIIRPYEPLQNTEAPIQLAQLTTDLEQAFLFYEEFVYPVNPNGYSAKGPYWVNPATGYKEQLIRYSQFLNLNRLYGADVVFAALQKAASSGEDKPILMFSDPPLQASHPGQLPLPIQGEIFIADIPPGTSSTNSAEKEDDTEPKTEGGPDPEQIKQLENAILEYLDLDDETKRKMTTFPTLIAHVLANPSSLYTAEQLAEFVDYQRDDNIGSYINETIRRVNDLAKKHLGAPLFYLSWEKRNRKVPTCIFFAPRILSRPILKISVPLKSILKPASSTSMDI